MSGDIEAVTRQLNNWWKKYNKEDPKEPIFFFIIGYKKDKVHTFKPDTTLDDYDHYQGDIDYGVIGIDNPGSRGQEPDPEAFRNAQFRLWALRKYSGAIVEQISLDSSSTHLAVVLQEPSVYDSQQCVSHFVAKTFNEFLVWMDKNVPKDITFDDSEEICDISKFVKNPKMLYDLTGFPERIRKHKELLDLTDSATIRLINLGVVN
ncbi:hypothetical protein CC80DRAFT_573144 [Byssothecium circinans]|uniref:Uncharacterized protein n=1 Tax=Byssothecium circinans TaxID=147558 RepID=A0A6A5TK57_9PLEO|nr:hypothetical protein CC80DRAFT_573144 [Byssothecium circinans]